MLKNYQNVPLRLPEILNKRQFNLKFEVNKSKGYQFCVVFFLNNFVQILNSYVNTIEKAVHNTINPMTNVSSEHIARYKYFIMMHSFILFQ